MKCRLVLASVVGVLIGVSGGTHSVQAVSLKVTPLEYRTTLSTGEKKKGFVDIANPDTVAVTVTFTVQAFRQTDDNGSLQFYDDPHITKGIQLDLDSVRLGPREVIHLAFLLDGSVLPAGDTYAAIFAASTPSSNGMAQAARVGTLLSIQNGTPAGHEAKVSALAASFFQVGSELTATIDVMNQADPAKYTGYYPKIVVGSVPYGQKTVEGPLVFAGRTRTIDYRQPGNYFGFLLIEASAEGGSKSQVVFAITGYWRWLMPIIAVALIVIALYVYNGWKKHRYRTHKKVTKIPVK